MDKSKNTTRIEKFAKDNFGIELLPKQVEYIAMVAAGTPDQMRWPKAMGLTTANKVILAYLQDGLKNAKTES